MTASTNKPIQLAVHGAAGRMGRRVTALAAVDPRFQVVAAMDHAASPSLGQEAGAVAGIAALGVAISSDWTAAPDTVIDFSLPEAVDAVIDRAVNEGWKLVVATTGLTELHKEKLARAGQVIPVVWAPSMSLAVNLTMRLAQQAAESLRNVPGGVDIEIIERHHRFKEDAPSGTALKFGELIAGKMEGPVQHVHGREGKTGQRGHAEIGYHAVRGGDDPGQHTILFGMMGETLELRVAASNRDCYAAGALAAAAWLKDKPPGLYSMFDVLGV
jgi:4-hydroxy-tetrahydrodipicolinate reductase